ncbi:dihydroorotase [Thermococcus sp.]
MHELVLKGKFLLDGKVLEGSIGVDSGLISRISLRDLKGERNIRFERELILPGLIDTHVHLRDFNQRDKETIESGTKAAIHGGITAVFDMPNTEPPIMSAKTFERRLRILERDAYADYAVGFLLAGNCEEASLTKADFYKIFMGASTGGLYSEDFKKDYLCAQGVVSLHAEDGELIKKHPHRPPEVEIRAIEKALKSARRIGKKLNVCHVSTEKGVRAILRENLPWVSFEVTPHHLFLTRKHYRKNKLLKVYPPLRDEKDQKGLWKQFRNIPIVASDHAPHTLEDKESGAAGIPGLETEVALLLDAANRGILAITDVVEKMHLNPIKFFGIRGRSFKTGNEATFTIVNPKKEWIVKPEEFYTKAEWSPWEGQKLKGKVVMTVLRGKVVMESDEIVSKPLGVRLDVQSNGN